ncbi:type VI secretion system ImpA family N-terminal domain-containing protein [Paraburkholderia sp. FT54]|uniref:type VI secretion system protein TssA n=1 Tax=Paraburkholderia sp. FT54 TaxID=3074437 RepID=UPI002877A379|nr:type VI secretion system ImpA family N-terminal domain-containing protein [Paraburkholderia sp. FT54]WNC91567.1 type VI secretion system ImpA family N-terminal domain-containing protein [Paraburkholderia sp. FT54]
METEFIAHQDWTEWLDALSDEAPCGPDLEYDPRFRELEQAVSGRPEAEYGATLVAAVPPDWVAANALCIELMAHTRDLRVVAWLARARLAREGVAGLADGLALAATLLDRNWDHVHPQLGWIEGDTPAVLEIGIRVRCAHAAVGNQHGGLERAGGRGRRRGIVAAAARGEYYRASGERPGNHCLLTQFHFADSFSCSE